MHRTKVIGVSGQMNSGKDTASDFICEEYSFIKVALADPLKRFGFQVFEFTPTQLWGPSGARNAVDSRYDALETWEAAELRLEALGKEFCADVLFGKLTLSEEETKRVDDAYKSLVRWFYNLLETYIGKLSPRIMLQTLGTEWGRNELHEDVWIDYLLRVARVLLHEDGNTQHWAYDPINGCIDTTAMDAFLRQGGGFPIPGIVVSDIRFENEFKKIRDAGGAVIRVLRPDTDDAATTIGIQGHASEAHDYSFDNFDFLLKNDGALVDLYRALRMYMHVFNAQHR